MSLDGQSGFYVAAKSDMGIDVFCTGVIHGLTQSIHLLCALATLRFMRNWDHTVLL